MKFSITFAFIVFALFFTTFSDIQCSTEAELVREIASPTEFDLKLKEFEHVLVKFYAPWCGHCKKLAPIFNEAASENYSKEVLFAKVDCTQDTNKPLCEKYEIKGYPTLKFFDGTKDKNNPSPYTGNRKTADIVRFINMRIGPTIRILNTEDSMHQFTSFKDKSDSDWELVLVEYNLKGECVPSPQFSNVAENMRDEISFGFVCDDKLLKIMDIKPLDATESSVSNSIVIMYKNFDQHNPVYLTKGIHEESETSIEQRLRERIVEERFPLVGHISQQNYNAYIESGLPLMWVGLKTTGNELDPTQVFLNMLKEVAAKFRKTVRIVYFDAFMFKEHMESLGWKRDLPGVVITDKHKRYVHAPEEITRDSLNKMMEDFMSNKLKRQIKSQEIPKENMERNVRVLVGYNFEEIVLDAESEDLYLVLFYAPWCGHCKKMMPEQDDLGERYLNHEKIKIAKIDATENDTPIEIRKFPTVMLFRKSGLNESGDKGTEKRAKRSIVDMMQTGDYEPLEYKGDQLSNNIEQWLLNNAFKTGDEEVDPIKLARETLEKQKSAEKTKTSDDKKAEDVVRDEL